MPLISVVTPVLNGEKYLAECIASVLSQTVLDWEMLIIDDGSTDATQTIAEEAAASDKRIRYFQHPGYVNLGVSKSRQIGFKEAQGSFIALLDADDECVPHRFERQLSLVAEYPKAVMYHSGIDLIDHQGGPAEHSAVDRGFNGFSQACFSYELKQYEYFLNANRVCNSTSLIRREALDGIRYGFPQLYQVEDWTLWVQLGGIAPFAFSPERLVRYRLHPDSATTKVHVSELRQIHAQLEFIMSVIAMCDDQEVLRIAQSIMGRHLSTAIYAYSGNQKRLGISVEFESSGSRFAKILRKASNWVKSAVYRQGHFE